MAHAAQMQFVAYVKQRFPEHFNGASVLEIGSMNINGTVRPFFEDCRYTGLDIVPGPGVDIVCPAHLFEGESGFFDTIISCETLEHDPHWNRTLYRAVDLLRPGGLLIITCASGNRPEHGTRRTSPGDSGSSVLDEWGDYYLNLNPEDIRSTMDIPKIFARHILRTVRNGQDLQFWGEKKRD